MSTNLIKNFVLKPTAEGKRRLEQIEAVLREKEAKEDGLSFTDGVCETLPYEFGPLDEVIEKVTKNCRLGKYKKALEAMNYQPFTEFVNVYAGVSKNDSYVAAFQRRANELISIAKSFYEYDKKQRLFMSDDIYDALIEKFKKCGGTEPSGILPTGSKSMEKTNITYPLLHNNMDKSYAIFENDPIPIGVKEADTVEDFLRRTYKSLNLPSSRSITLEISPKIDGVSVNGTLHGNKLINVQTRGDNDESVVIYGMEDIVIGDKTDDITKSGDIGVQFECFVTDKDREKASNYLNLDKEYVSNRHAAAGITHRLASQPDSKLLKYLSLYPINTEGYEKDYLDRMKDIQDIAIVPKDMIDRVTISGNMTDLLYQIREVYDDFSLKRDTLSYSIDGLVITVAKDRYQDTIGRNGRTNKYQIALKFNPSTAVGVVDDIELVAGKKGYRTIQVNLEKPVSLDGVKYDHIPVLSYELFRDLNLRKGSTVQVLRVGDVIPAISVNELGKGKALQTPRDCPYCGKPLTIKAKKLYCDNPLCDGNIIGKFTAFFETLDMKSYSEAFARMLLMDFGAKSVNDFFSITKERIADKGIKHKKLDSFVNNIVKAIRNHYDYEILAALSIPTIGTETSKFFMNSGVMLKDLVFALENKLTAEEFYDKYCITADDSKKQKVLDIYNKILAFAKATPSIVLDINLLTPYVENTISTKKKANKKIGHSGGDLSREVKELCNALNYEVVDSRIFDELIVADKSSDSTKMKVAKKKKLPIYTESEFMEKYS